MGRTRVGTQTTIEGEIEADDDLLITGRVQGRIEGSGRVLIDSTAVVEAEVGGRDVEVLGTVSGDVHATERAQIHSEGEMVGDIRSPRILIADGAQFSGSVDMDQRGDEEEEDQD